MGNGPGGIKEYIDRLYRYDGFSVHSLGNGATMLLIWGTVNIFTVVISANIRMTVISALTDLFTPTETSYGTFGIQAGY